MNLSLQIPIPPIAWKRTNYWQGKHLTDREQRAYQRDVQRWALSKRPPLWDQGGKFLVMMVFTCKDLRRRDVDNLAKNILDACNGILWTDDHQAQAIVGVKVLDRERPRVDMRVIRLAGAWEQPLLLRLVEFAEGVEADMRKLEAVAA